ncbi:MAG TPA: putative lipid II flippase FtsW [Steroidobacteraceae bacterium]|nr:putative lipid II flippase FtsW [Steroidobacteraceae bacterium]
MSAAAASVTRGLTRSQRFQWDPVMVAVTMSLLLVGLVMVTSASISIADTRQGDPFFYLERQLLFAFVGCAAGVVLATVRADAWDRLGVVLLIVAIGLLIAVLIPGIGAVVNGSRRWLRVGPLNFQASELARVFVIVYLCSYAVRRREELRDTLLGFVKPMAPLALAAGLLLIEPDFGAATVLLVTGVGLLFIAGARLRYVLILCAGGAALLGLIAVSSAYRVKRLLAFLDPWSDPFASGFQLTQSLIAIGRGEWFGVGLGASVQKLFYLPEAHTDFVFAVLAEELGLIGIVMIVGLFVILVWRSFYIARLARDAGLAFQSYLASAFGLWIGLQAFINIGVNMGLLPTKGLTLPLVSYGRSSLVVTLAWVGLMLRIYHESMLAGRTATARLGESRA